MFTMTIDWLSFTVKEKSNDMHEFLNMLTCASSSRSTPARYGYCDGIAYDNGLQILYSAGREDMGEHIILSGTALTSIGHYLGINPWEILQKIIICGGKITRMDLAKDAKDERIDLGNIWRLAESKSYGGNARSIGQIKGIDGGQTLYIGSRKSEKMIRIYNKAAEQGLIGEDWIRCELELKGDTAKAIAILIASNPENREAIFRGICEGLFNCADKGYCLLMACNASSIGAPKIEHHSDREKWILTQVIRPVLEHFRLHPDSAAIDLLISEIELQKRANRMFHERMADIV